MIKNLTVGTWEIFALIKTSKNEAIVAGYDENSPTPYVTWNAYFGSYGIDCSYGNYFEDKETAINDMLERAGV